MRRVVVIFLFSAAIFGGCGVASPPSDETLIDSFRRDQSAFEELRKSLCAGNAPRIVMLDPEWSEPKATTQEIATFYPLLNRVGAKGVYYDGGCSFRLPVWATGFAGGGDMKEYVYRPGDRYKGAEVLSSLNDERLRDGTKVVFYKRQFDGDWYLTFEHWP